MRKLGEGVRGRRGLTTPQSASLPAPLAQGSLWVVGPYYNIFMSGKNLEKYNDVWYNVMVILELYKVLHETMRRAGSGTARRTEVKRV